eukprot:6456655-Amphidinium_carterae.1
MTSFSLVAGGAARLPCGRRLRRACCEGAASCHPGAATKWPLTGTGFAAQWLASQAPSGYEAVA